MAAFIGTIKPKSCSVKYGAEQTKGRCILEFVETAETTARLLSEMEGGRVMVQVTLEQLAIKDD